MKWKPQHKAYMYTTWDSLFLYNKVQVTCIKYYWYKNNSGKIGEMIIIIDYKRDKNEKLNEKGRK